MKRAGYLLLGLLLVWVSCWLSLGMLWGQPTLLLHPLQASQGLRVLYLVMLYAGMVGLLWGLWKRNPPATHWGRPGPLTVQVWAMGVGGICLQRLCLAGALQGLCWPTSQAWLSAILLAPLLALVEEAVFRGYLYGALRSELGGARAAWMVSVFFSLVHLFRPGALPFKLAYGFGLVLTSLVLTVVVEKAGIWAAAAMHSSWISANILDPPGRVESGWWSGLAGEPSAGLCSWILLLLMGLTCWKTLRANGEVQES
ncbi:CPBP family intramembrane metalloprotease [bacterium]|nr:CPBP family intramembrane metalloprotease [bacterium]